jgi:hypothetical protein
VRNRRVVKLASQCVDMRRDIYREKRGKTNKGEIEA